MNDITDLKRRAGITETRGDTIFNTARRVVQLAESDDFGAAYEILGKLDTRDALSVGIELGLMNDQHDYVIAEIRDRLLEGA